MPSLHFLSEPKNVVRDSSLSKDALEQNARLLEGVLEDFGVKGEIIQVRPGPVVTLYELEPAPGIKSSRVIGLADDIARSMSAIACPRRRRARPQRHRHRTAQRQARDRLSARAPGQPRFRDDQGASWRWRSARPSAASRSSPTSPRCRTCWSPAPPARASRSAINTMILSLLYRHDAGGVPADHDRPEDAGAVASMTASRIC